MNKQLVEGVDFYFNESGLMVMSERYLRERGYCCGNGCRHCPYEYSRVEEPYRSRLLAKRESENNRSSGNKSNSSS